MVKTNFLPSRDGFHFPNNFTNNIKIVDSLSVTTYGRCGGMAHGSLDYYTRGIPVPTCNTADFGDAQVPNDGTPLADYIFTRLIDSFAKYGAEFIYKNYESDHETILAGKGLIRETKEDEWPALRNYLDSGKPVVIGLIAYQGGLADCHQVVAYGYTITNGIIKINIYDNNMPDDDSVTIESTEVINANPHWNEVNSAGQISNSNTGVDLIWRGFFVEPDCDKSPDLSMPVDLFIAQGINTNASRICVGDSLNCTLTIRNFGTYNAHFRFPHLYFEKIADSPSPHPAQPAEQLYDGSPAITLTPNQELTLTKTYPNMGPTGRYVIKAKYLPGTQTLSSITMPPNIWTGAKPVTQIEVINKVALYIDTYGQKQVLLYSTAQTPIATPKITSTTKPTLSQPTINSKIATSTLAKERDILNKLNSLKSQTSVIGGAYKLGMNAHTTSSQFKNPLTYAWKIDATTPIAQTATSNPVEITIQVGKTGGPYTYDHKIDVTATDSTGAMAKDAFILKLPTPKGTISANYEDPLTVTGKSETLPYKTGSTTAYSKLVISAETQGMFGKCTYTWEPLTSSTGTKIVPQLLTDGSKALYVWPLKGDASELSSYQNQTVKVTVKDEIGQTINSQAIIENPITRHKNPLNDSSIPILQAEYDDPRQWSVMNELAITPINARTQMSIQISKETTMNVRSVPSIQMTRVTYGQKTPTRKK